MTNWPQFQPDLCCVEAWIASQPPKKIGQYLNTMLQDATSTWGLEKEWDTWGLEKEWDFG